MGIPMAYNTGTTNTYTEKTVKRGTIALNPGPSLAPSYNWFNGVDVTSSQYLLYSDTYTTGQVSQANSKPTAWSTPDLSDTSLLNLINTLPERIGQPPFTYAPVALKWLHQSNRYFLLKNNFENIVTSGLVLNLDGSWPNSYSGTTTWFDLSGQGNNGTLYNGPTFNSDSGGGISFDGADDYMAAGTLPTSLQGNPKFSIGGWFKRSGTWQGGATWGIGTPGGATNINSYSWSIDNSIGIDLYGTTTYNTNQTYSLTEWKHVIWTYNGSGFNRNNIIIYINGSACTGNDLTVMRENSGTPNLGSNGITLGRVSAFENAYYGKPIIGNFQVYNRVLSPSEIMQNFNAQGYRFGYSADTIVTSGLTINLDAANGMSYPGSGTTWYDISENGGYHFTLRNGVSGGTYNGVTCFSFDGTDDNARWVDTNGIKEDIGTECTISIWMNGNGVDLGQTCCRLISFNNNVDVNVDYSDYFCMAACNKIGYLPCYTQSLVGGLCDGSFGSNTPMYTTDFKLVTVRWSTISDTIDVLVNNSSIYSESLTASPIDYRNIKRIALASNAGNIEFSNIRIASMQMYSRRLSNSELTQNYNAQKGRFGY